ncbi:MAG: hypothetical protein ACK5IC_09205 [Moheibacter sp.]
MKKIGFLIIGAFLFVACDNKPGGNKDILPVVKEGTVEAVSHDHDTHHGDENTHKTEEEHNHNHTTEDTHTTHEIPTEEPKGSTH